MYYMYTNTYNFGGMNNCCSSLHIYSCTGWSLRWNLMQSKAWLSKGTRISRGRGWALERRVGVGIGEWRVRSVEAKRSDGSSSAPQYNSSPSPQTHP